MPKVCEFFGIAIYFYHNDHPPPHFHARYAGDDFVFDIESLEVINGQPSPRVRRMVVEWAELHRDELRRAWRLSREGASLDPISPLE